VVFSDWCEEIVYMIPKESGVDLLEKQRPLELQEALRKVAAGIKKNRVKQNETNSNECTLSRVALHIDITAEANGTMCRGDKLNRWWQTVSANSACLRPNFRRTSLTRQKEAVR
jgi:hypothetical protein